MANNTDFATCKCGCREHVSGKSVYRPGHDARHVSRLLATADEVFKRTNALTELVQRAKSELPSDALYAKFIRALDKKNPSESGYAETEAEEIEAEEAAQDGTSLGYKEFEVKIGRWEYPARQYTDLSTERNTKRDGSGEWVALDMR